MTSRRLRIALMLVLLAGISWLLYSRGDQLRDLPPVSPGAFAALVALHMCTILALAYGHRTTLGALGIRMPAREWIGLPWVSVLCSQFLPGQAGNLVRGAYLNRVRGLGLGKFAATAALFAACIATTLGVCGLALATGEGVFGKLTPVYAALALAGALVVFVPNLAERVAKSQGWPAEWAPSWRKLTRAPVLVRLMGVAFAVVTFSACRTWISCHTLGMTLGFWDTTQAAVGAVAASLIGITPGSLGIREAAFAALLIPRGYPEAPLLLAALLDRASLWTAVIPVGVAFQWRLLGAGRPM